MWAPIVLSVLGVAGQAEQRAVKQRVAPVYPEMAKRLRVTGVVQLEVTVNVDGQGDRCEDCEWKAHVFDSGGGSCVQVEVCGGFRRFD